MPVAYLGLDLSPLRVIATIVLAVVVTGIIGVGVCTIIYRNRQKP
jgi:hypothetical protein